MNRIVAVRRDETGSIAEYKLENGAIISRKEACDLAEIGHIEGVSTFTTRDGGTAIRSDRGQPNYSLDDLPTF